MARKNISEEDAELFRSSVGEVNRLVDDRVRHPAERPSPRPRPRTETTSAPVQDMLSDADMGDQGEEAIQDMSFARTGLSPRQLRKLRRGQQPIDAQLDLHDMTVTQAQSALARFLVECLELELRCVRIIHGKGFGSAGGMPVIKARLNRWLRMRDEVLAFAPARPADGGSGAVYVLLRR